MFCDIALAWASMAEARELTKNQILAQSATAMLAQANAISQNILSLLAA
jgi:flagellin-like hook-associated protein FlgL